MDWTSASLAELITELRGRQGDSTDVEVKAAAEGVPSLGPTLCAFANMPEGGTIILGLDEASGFAPVSLPDVAALEQGVASQAREGVTPAVRCEFHMFQVGGSPVLVVGVEGLPLHQRPARHGGQAYLRQSDGDYVMSPQELAQLELLKTQSVRPTHPDRQPVPATSPADLDPNLLYSYLAAARAGSRRYAEATDAQILQYTGVTTRGGGELTMAGLYSLGVSPQTVSPSLGITAAVQLPRTSDGPRSRDLVHLVGPIPDLLEDAMAWVARNTRTSMTYDARGHGVDQTELPTRAVREIVANALVHRNLDAITDSKRVEVRLLHDRLVITSPGGLWGVSESQLGRPGAKSAVNPVLFDICKNVRMADGSRIIEGEGGGIREAMEALRQAGLRPPRFADNGIQFSVIISRHTLIAEDDLDWLADVTDELDLSSEERAILVSMRHGEVWNNARVRHEFAPIDSREAKRSLQRLVSTKLAISEGERGSTLYVIAPQHATPAAVEVTVTDPASTARPATRRARRRDNSSTILAALDRPLTIRELITTTGLTDGQVRFALRRLQEAGHVTMLGAQGVRTTRYERTRGARGKS